MSSGHAGGDLVEVRLEGLPLGEYRLAQQHQDELVREFTLIAPDDDDDESVPRRVLALIAEVQRYEDLTADARRAILDATDRGEETVDVVFRVPPEFGDLSHRLLELLEEADEYCRGGNLLTLATSPETAAFRRWYLRQFVEQTAAAR